MQVDTKENERQQRQLELIWFAAKTMTEIKATVSDIAVLQQQEVDLLRRLVERSALP